MSSTDAPFPLEHAEELFHLLVNADAVVRHRGDAHGLCDHLDPTGAPAQSELLALWLQHARHTYRLLATVDQPPPASDER